MLWILTKVSSLAAPEVVILKTSSAASDETFVKMMVHPFEWWLILSEPMMVCSLIYPASLGHTWVEILPLVGILILYNFPLSNTFCILSSCDDCTSLSWWCKRSRDNVIWQFEATLFWHCNYIVWESPLRPERMQSIVLPMCCFIIAGHSHRNYFDIQTFQESSLASWDMIAFMKTCFVWHIFRIRCTYHTSRFLHFHISVRYIDAWMWRCEIKSRTWTNHTFGMILVLHR